MADKQQTKQEVINCLTIAGSDPCAGAGIQADLRCFNQVGCYGLSVITALTVQNTQGVAAVHAVAADLVQQQLHNLLDDVNIAAIKIGMLATTANLNVIIDTLSAYRHIPVVIDPVLRASDGTNLLEADATAEIAELFQLATLVTPNQQEFQQLKPYLANTACLVTGGDSLQSYCIDTLYAKGTIKEFKHPKVITMNTHGTGCSLSSAITAFLAQQNSLSTACEQAIALVQHSLHANAELKFGQGHGPCLFEITNI